MSNLPQLNDTSARPNPEPEIPLVMTIKEYFAKKDYKFYLAATATVIFAGVGLYLLTSKSPKPKTHRSKKSRSSRQAGTNESGSHKGKDYLKKKLTRFNRRKDRSVKSRDEAEVEEFERYSIEQINALPKERRDTASQQLKNRGNVAYGQSNYEKAIKLYTQAIAFNQDPVFYSNRAACYYNTDQFSKAIEDCNSALQMNPYYVKAINRRAMAYERTSRFEESLHDYTAACIIGDFRNDSATASIDRLLKKVASIKAQEIIKNRIKRLPSAKFISSYLDSYRKEITDHDDDVTEELESSNLEKNADDYFKLAEKLVRQQQYEEAMKMYEKAIELGCTNMPRALNMHGTFTYLMGDSKNALDDFQKALELKPDYTQLYIKRATVYMEQGNMNDAWKEFDEAVKINPNDPDIYYHSASFDMAVKEYQRRIELDPDFIFAHIQLAIAQYKSGFIAEGMKTFTQGLQKFSQSAEMHNYYGELLADQKLVDEAMEQFDKAIELQKGNFALPFVNKAMLCFHVKNDPAQAEEFCRRALEIEPESDIANTIMSEILLARGNLESALQYLEKYQEVARTEAELQGILEYAEAARSHIAFKRSYPQLADRLVLSNR